MIMEHKILLFGRADSSPPPRAIIGCVFFGNWLVLAKKTGKDMRLPPPPTLAAFVLFIDLFISKAHNRNKCARASARVPIYK